MTEKFQRWTPSRKAAVVAQIERGDITVEEACAKYEIDIAELLSWQMLIARHGVRGLRVTRMQEYQPKQERQNVIVSRDHERITGKRPAVDHDAAREKPSTENLRQDRGDDKAERVEGTRASAEKHSGAGTTNNS